MVKLLLIDNNDSFTYNIVNQIRSNIDGVELDVAGCDEIEADNLGGYDKIIFSPGPQLPRDYPIMAEILRKYDETKAVLGICLGHQAICEYYGGEIKHMRRVVHGEPTEIECDAESRLFRGIGTCVVGRYHSWVACNLPSMLRVTAKTADGLVMAVEHKDRRVCGVQFHPESIITEYGTEIMRNFIYDF